MEMPAVLKQLLEEQSNELKSENIRKSAQKISLRYRTEIKKGQNLINDRTDSVAYAVSRMPATFGTISSIMEKVSLLPDFLPKTFADIGSGTGSAVWAATNYFDLKELTCLERNSDMRAIGQELTQKAKDFFPTEPVWKDFDLVLTSPPRAELICAAYVLNELKENYRSEALLKLWNATQCVLVLAEPATPENFRQMKAYRQTLIDNGAFIAAPCPHQKECQNDWCHFGCRISRTKMHRMAKSGDAPYEDEKFCYLIACRKEYPIKSARILRHPLIEKGKVTLSLCSSDGIFEKTFSKKDGIIYKKARKAKWGDSFIPKA